MMKRKLMSLMVAPVVLSFSSCYVETVTEKNPRKEPPGTTLVPKNDVNACKFTRDQNSGCFQGDLPAAPKIVVEGKEFNDVNHFTAHLDTLFAPEAKKDALESYKYEAQSGLSNDNWTEGFQIFVKGPATKTQTALFQKGFYINDLPSENGYEVRVQKTIKFVATKTVVSTEKDVAPAVTKKNYCVTIYADASFDVRENERSRLTFDHFRMFSPEENCNGSRQYETKITF